MSNEFESNPILYGAVPRSGKTFSQEVREHPPFYVFKIEVNTPKSLLKKHILEEKRVNEFYQELVDKARIQLVEYIKANEDLPDEVIYAFVKQYIDFEFTQDYDTSKLEYVITVKPIWKKVNEIDVDSEESKFLTNYFLSEE